MNFELEEAIQVLERTPDALEHLLKGLSIHWLQCNEGADTWNCSQVIDHLIEGEKHNWIPRVESILHGVEKKTFPSFDRFAHLKQSERPIDEKLSEFNDIRKVNIKKLRQLINREIHLEMIGIHPEFGDVTVKQLLSTWVVHDLTHIAQIVRVMAERYRMDVGPWDAYLGILNRKNQ
ncbi:DinB family protein [Caldibacillus lycopersici]|uniref:DinB family protein n=1 Tax=Perspicuibacillus lycopersici TaxID=1325689 RepID=A0AAE3LS39_9BACI|nr:DinB family protein [Perspicuibacillus lycopersici]MCU9612343.1 DinB family protein [Perspicuibacillus lycopersici]